MEKFVKVKLRNKGKIYNFKTGYKKYKSGQTIVVKTSRGIECGEIVSFNPCRCKCKNKKDVPDCNKIIRIANKKDLENFKKNKQKAKESLLIFEKKIAKHNLEMKPIDAEITLDSKKIIFYFFSEKRVDFRKLVKDIATTFKMKIELRQIGIRDEAKMMGGLGICGRPFCCSLFLNDFKPVLIKTAKKQGIFLSPSKISGNCGRLMCCLKYEENSYLKFLEITPSIGAKVITPNGQGEVVEVNFLTGNLRVKIESNDLIMNFNRKDINVVKNKKEKDKKEGLTKV